MRPVRNRLKFFLVRAYPHRSRFPIGPKGAEFQHIIWRVRVAGEWLYVYLLIEFQSRIDPWMAVRVMVYTGFGGKRTVPQWWGGASARPLSSVLLS